MAPLSDCALGATYAIVKEYKTSFSADIALSSYQQGVELTLDFAVATGARTSVSPSDCFGCEVVRVTESTLVLQLSAESGFYSHLNGVGFKAPKAEGETAPSVAAITCDAVTPPPPSPPPPPYYGLRPTYRVSARSDGDRGRNGREDPLFEAETELAVWEAGVELLYTFTSPIQIKSVWYGKQTMYTTTQTTFELQKLDPPPKKLKFSARGNADDIPTI
eukprot:4923911-Pleurochrysis_carterae.AAC.1